MTENKRFTFTKNSVAKNIKTPICDYHGEILTIGEVLDRMNTLTEENEQLKSLLKEVEHELTSLTGLSAYDKCVSQIGYDEVFHDDRIDLDYSELLKKIEVNLND